MAKRSRSSNKTRDASGAGTTTTRRTASRKAAGRKTGEAKTPGRAILIRIDQEIRNELDVLARMRNASIQNLGHEAICDLLRKHGRPTGLMDAFKQSAKPQGTRSRSARKAEKS